MIKYFLYKAVLALFICTPLFPQISLASEIPAASEYYRQLSPLIEQSKTDREIFRHLRQNHYSKRSIDDDLSSKIFDNYLEDLDPGRMFFLASDIEAFEPCRDKLDDALKNGDLEAAFNIYNRYQLRYIERLVYLIRIMEESMQDINFSLDESILTDRTDAPWPVNRADLEHLWKKALKSDILNLMLDGKSDDEIKEMLLKRYRSQLNRAQQSNSEDVFQRYMNSFTSTFDPHSQYFSPRISENFNINMSLSLEGIGAMLTTDNDYTKVVRLVPAGPADKAGELKPDDRIIGVGQDTDGEIVDVVGWRLDDVVDLIRGPKDSTVRLLIIPADAIDDHLTKVIKIVRNTVKLEEQAAKSEVIPLKRGETEYRLGVITIPTFYLDVDALRSGDRNYKSTTRDVRNLLAELESENIDGVIIDLRDNGGGSLQEANSLTGLFIRRGPVVQIKHANEKVEKLYDRDPRIFYTGPLAVVVNRLSASASEIFAGAMQDYGRAVIIGEDTFGKGTVQTLVNLERGQLKLTSAKFYRISGGSTQHKGISPDIEYPSMYDKGKIGEDSYEEALPWDTISGVTHEKYMDFSTLIPQLNELHNKRIADNADYLYLQSMLDYLKTLRQKQYLSLNRQKREQEKIQAEKKRLELENMRRRARGLPLISNIEEVDDMDNEEDDKAAKNDPVLIESSNILVDLITLIDQPADKEPVVRAH